MQVTAFTLLINAKELINLVDKLEENLFHTGLTVTCTGAALIGAFIGITSYANLRSFSIAMTERLGFLAFKNSFTVYAIALRGSAGQCAGSRITRINRHKEMLRLFNILIFKILPPFGES